ncbi:MAG: hypothetical protein ABH869_07700 [Candidatus Omnitrophota bacterium]
MAAVNKENESGVVMNKKKIFANIKGFSLMEVMFVAVVSLMVIGAIVSVWTYTYKTWTGENVHTQLRVQIMEALETIKRDMRLSSATYMSFYPENSDVYTAASLPVAETDANGLLTLDSNGKISWAKTVIYHLYSESDGTQTLRRTVYDPRDNTMTEDERYSQLGSVVTGGTGGSSSTTDTEFLKNVDVFEISSSAAMIDFYDDSSTPVRVGKVILGWVQLDSGNHTVRMEVTGKNDNSTGYDFGIDSLILDPGASVREFEYYDSSYAPGGMLSLSGGSVSLQNSSVWGNNNYLEFIAGGEGSYMQVTDAYDLWRESSFESVALDNTGTTGDEMRIELDIPEEDEEGLISWFVHAEANDLEAAGRDGAFPAVEPLTIRTIVTADNVGKEGALVQVKFSSSVNNDLVIANAYITKRDGITGSNGLANQAPGSLTVEEYHRHQQLFFKAADGTINSGITISADSFVWSEWTAFPLRTDSDYFITFHVSDISTVDCRYWEDSVGTVHTYYVTGSTSDLAGTPDWTAETVNPSANIFVTSAISVADTEGTVESQAFDTTLSAPNYNKIKWSENKPLGTTIFFKTRSSADQYMTGATDWDLIAGSSSNPHSLAMGSGRYVQFLAELSTELFWKSAASQLSYADYIEAQVDFPSDDQFPRDSTGDFLVTDYNVPWIDDVEIDWPGLNRMAAIEAYIAKKDSYGQAKVTVDGKDLVKTLSVHINVSDEVSGRTLEEDHCLEIEPRNTGK